MGFSLCFILCGVWRGEKKNLFDVESRADVHEHGFCGSEFAGDVERGGEGDEDFFACGYGEVSGFRWRLRWLFESCIA